MPCAAALRLNCASQLSKPLGSWPQSAPSAPRASGASTKPKNAAATNVKLNFKSDKRSIIESRPCRRIFATGESYVAVLPSSALAKIQLWTVLQPIWADRLIGLSDCVFRSSLRAQREPPSLALRAMHRNVRWESALHHLTLTDHFGLRRFLAVAAHNVVGERRLPVFCFSL